MFINNTSHTKLKFHYNRARHIVAPLKALAILRGGLCFYEQCSCLARLCNWELGKVYPFSVQTSVRGMPAGVIVPHVVDNVI